jgi:hypothetical protein
MKDTKDTKGFKVKRRISVILRCKKKIFVAYVSILPTKSRCTRMDLRLLMTAELGTAEPLIKMRTTENADQEPGAFGCSRARSTEVLTTSPAVLRDWLIVGA